MIGSPERVPRFRALISGLGFVEPLTVEVNHHASAIAGRYALALASASSLPWRLADWMAMTTFDVTLELSLDGGMTYRPLISGPADSLAVDPLHRTIRIEGRDRAASLLSRTTFGVLQNKSARDVVRALAAAHGLTPVISAAGASVGRLYEGTRSVTTLIQGARLRSDWDILVALAQIEGCDVYVSGNELFYELVVDQMPSIATIPDSSILSLKIIRSLPLTQPGSVIVRSWNSANQSCVLQEEPVPSSTTQASTDPVSYGRFEILKPNLQPDEARSLARRVGARLASRSQVLRMTMLGDADLMPRQAILPARLADLSGQIYRVDQVARQYSARSGYTQSVRAILPAAPPLEGV